MGRPTFAGLAALWLFSSVPTMQESAISPYRVVPGWGALPGGAGWGEVPGMAIDANGQIFARDGSVRLKVDDAVAEGVAVDVDGNIYVGETVPDATLTGQPGGHIVRKLAKAKSAPTWS